MPHNKDSHDAIPPNNLHHHILDNLKTAILLIEPNLTVSYINPTTESLLTISDQHIHKKAITTLFHEEEDTVVKLLDAINNHETYTKHETILTLHSNEEITVDYAITPITDTHHTSLIIELQPLNRLLHISQEENLLTSQQNNKTLLHDITHEIKNPLNDLRGTTQLLTRELDDPRLHDYTNIIIEETNHLRNLMDNMLSPNKIPDQKPTNIHEVLERVQQLIEVESSNNMRIIRNYNPNIPDITNDQKQLIQAMLNIIRNALQALNQSPPKHETPNITLHTHTLRQFTIRSHHHHLIYHVDIINNKPNIPPNITQSIFLPMINNHANNSELKLSISQSILNHHQDLIKCHNEPNQTKFSLFIPIKHEQ